MTLFIPAVWYRARAVIERRWGWSPVEEAVLLSLRDRSGTSTSLAADLRVPRQVAEAAISRLMRFGLIEIRLLPEPALAMTDAARAHLLAGRPLPERFAQREIPVSIVFDKLGGSVFRRREVAIKPLKKIPSGSVVVDYPDGDEIDTDATMESRVRRLLAASLRPGEAFTMIRSNHTVIERWALAIDLERARHGVFPEGSSEVLRAAISDHIESGRVPAAPPARRNLPDCLVTPIKTTFLSDQIVLGALIILRD